tara:strand:+ start:1357 stop:2508 length:1152 start_codon:yes stop_codon:yes gene_type:complete
MTRLHSFFFIINGFLIGLFSLASTPFLKLQTLFIIYLSFTFFHLILLSVTSSINKKRLEIILIIFFFTSIAIINTLMREHYEPVSGWPSLSAFAIFSFYYIFKEEFDQNSKNIILTVITILFFTLIFLVIYIDYPLLGLTPSGQSTFENLLREDIRLGNVDKEIFYNKNYVAKYFFWTFFFFFIYRFQKDKIDKLNILLLVIIILLTLFLASAKLFIISLINFFTYLSFSNYNKKIITFIPIVLLLFLFFYFFNFSNNVTELISSKAGSLTGDSFRLSLIFDGVKLTADNFFGSGLYYTREQLITYTHNNYIETIVAIGPFLSLFFFIYMYLRFKKFYKVKHINIIFNTLIFLSFFQTIYFDFFILPVVLCFISNYQKINDYK